MFIGGAYDARSTREKIAALGAMGSLAVLPDLDVIGITLGFEETSIAGHRGYSHSLLFATAVAGLTYVLARKFKWGSRPVFTALLAFVAVLSHGLMDAMTYRTRGIPFLWPITDARFVFPWRPIPAAPHTSALFSRRSLEVAAVELVYFLPLVLTSLVASFARIRQWVDRLLDWMGLGSKPPIPVPVRPRRLRMHDMSLRLLGVMGAVAITLAVAHVHLSQSRLVAWIEQSTQQSLAVSLMRNPEFRHLH